MKQGLSLRVSQHLALTPQLQQSIRLLQLSTLELGQEVDQMLDDNPFLERADDEIEREQHGVQMADQPVSASDRSAESDSESIAESDHFPLGSDQNGLENGLETSWEGDGSVDLSPDDSEWGGDAPARLSGAGDEDDTDSTQRLGRHESLTDSLHRQALGLRLSELDREVLRFLIESLNDDGWLEDSLESLAEGLAGRDDLERLDELVHHFTVALRLLQSLEPVGVGARSLQECLLLQLRALRQERPDDETAELAERVCRQPMDLLARRDTRRLAQLTGADDAAIRAAMTLIARLDPKPGRRFADLERQVVVPDVIVSTSGRGSATRLRVQLNPDVMPRLRVQDIYANALRGGGKGEAHGALQQRLQEARWFIKNIQQRFDTILRVSKAIVERQKNFFVHGELAMRPLVLREIADELGLHESTISRVTTAKYMATPFGTFELKYFFGSGLGTETGGNASSTAVRALIKQFVAAESPKKPLSDNQISDMLKEQGIECARRTVAKYREALKNRARQSEKSTVNQLQLFLPCAAGVEDHELLAA
jgi:RNA polymerase sigma-54 factor